MFLEKYKRLATNLFSSKKPVEVSVQESQENVVPKSDEQ
jgi:hypothetical protein